ncbi:hypothetical protein JOB18_042793 [Solea senegalensis]|uniref:Uncharacterized protein n=1 Tax=Solea senegalensis TaxID=28829 RepID=A0AAV6RL56_SOLSE|nr:hypothetical protein JOB18_042793 [Solea senegalensis]
MDSAQTRQWLEALSTQEAHLSRQEQFQTTMAEHLVRNLTDLLRSTTSPPAALKPPVSVATPTQAASFAGSGVGCRLHFSRPLGCCCWLRAVHRSVPLTACRWSLSGSFDPPVPRCVGRDRLIGAEPTVVDWCPGHGVPFLLC